MLYVELSSFILPVKRDAKSLLIMRCTWFVCTSFSSTSAATQHVGIAQCSVFFVFRLCLVSGQKIAGMILGERSPAQTTAQHCMLSSCLGLAAQERVLHETLSTGLPSADLESVASRKGARSGGSLLWKLGHH